MLKNDRTKLSGVLSYIAIFVNIVSGLVFTPWLMRKLGTSEYAIYSLGMSIISYLTIELGISEIVTRLAVKYVIEDNQKAVNKLVGIAAKIYILIDAIIVLVALIMYVSIDKFYTNLTVTEIESLKSVFIVCAVTVVLILPEMPFSGLYAAYGKVYIDRILSLIYKISYVVVTYISVMLSNQAITVVLCYAALTVLLKLFKLLYILRSEKITVDVRTKDHDVFQQLLRMSVWIIIATLSSRYFFSIIPTMLGRYSNSFEITVFSVASAVEGYLFLFSTALNGVFLLRITNMVLKQQDNEITTLMVRIGRIQLMVISCIVIGIVGFGREFIGYWVGDQYGKAYICLLIILFPCLVYMTQTVALEATYAKDKLKVRALVYASGTIISTVLTCILSPKYGAIGASVGIGLAEIICYIIAMNVVYKKLMNIDVWRFFKETHVKMLIPLFASVILAITINRLIETTSIYMFIVKAMIWAFAHLIILYTFTCNESEKKLITQIFRTKRNK